MTDVERAKADHDVALRHLKALEARFASTSYFWLDSLALAIARAKRAERAAGQALVDHRVSYTDVL